MKYSKVLAVRTVSRHVCICLLIIAIGDPIRSDYYDEWPANDNGGWQSLLNVSNVTRPMDNRTAIEFNDISETFGNYSYLDPNSTWQYQSNDTYDDLEDSLQEHTTNYTNIRVDVTSGDRNDSTKKDNSSQTMDSWTTVELNGTSETFGNYSYYDLNSSRHYQSNGTYYDDLEDTLREYTMNYTNLRVDVTSGDRNDSTEKENTFDPWSNLNSNPNTTVDQQVTVTSFTPNGNFIQSNFTPGAEQITNVTSAGVDQTTGILQTSITNKTDDRNESYSFPNLENETQTVSESSPDGFNLKQFLSRLFNFKTGHSEEISLDTTNTSITADATNFLNTTAIIEVDQTTTYLQLDSYIEHDKIDDKILNNNTNSNVEISFSPNNTANCSNFLRLHRSSLCYKDIDIFGVGLFVIVAVGLAFTAAMLCCAMKKWRCCGFRRSRDKYKYTVLTNE